MNLARTFLETAYPDASFTRAHMEKLEAAGELRWLKVLMERLERTGDNFAPPGMSAVDAAVELERLQMVQFIQWREELARKVNNPALLDVELVFVELATPQAVTIHERDNSYAIALDRRMTSFLGALTAWAYVATTLELQGVSARDARLTFLNALSDHIVLNYTKQLPSANLEERELMLDGSLSELDRRLLRDASSLAAKFVLYHELGHVHLKHFEDGQADHALSVKTAEVSTFEEHNIELDADAFANEHLMDKDGTVISAVAAKMAAPIYLLILAMKETLLPSASVGIEDRARKHPPSAERAEKLIPAELPPAFIDQFEVYFLMPKLLSAIYSSGSIQGSAGYFARHTGSGG
jgi:hypothetical protein